MIELQLLTGEKDANLRSVVRRIHKKFGKELVSIYAVKIAAR